MRKVIIAVSLMALPSLALAQTRTVAAGGGADFTTIAAAIADVTANAATPDVVQIIDSSVYNEVVTLSISVSLEGTNTGNNRPVIALPINPAGDANDGLVVNVATGSVGLKNLILIPALTTPPTDDLVRSVGNTALNLNLSSVLIAPNNGTNQPLSYDGLSLQSFTGATRIADDGITLGANTNATMRNFVVTHIQGTVANNDCVVCINGTVTNTILGGCVFSFAQRVGYQANGNFTINAAANRALFLGNRGFAAIWFAGAGTAPRVLNGVNVINNASTSNTAQGWAIEQQNGGGQPFTLSNAIIAGNQAQGLLISTVGVTAPITVDRVTIARNGTGTVVRRPPIEVATGCTATINITNSIVGGLSSSGEIVHNGTGTLTLDHCSVITNGGPDSLFLPATFGTGTVVITSCISNQPGFIETANFQSASFYDVDNPAYAGMGTGSSNLGGGADFIGSLPAELAVISAD